MPDVIRTKGLTKFYGDKPVVRSLDLRIPQGCVYGFLGRNGAGKTTTLKMLTGMVQPDQGEIEVLGEPISEQSPGTKRRIAYIAESHPLFLNMRVGEIIKFTKAFYSQWDDELVEQILDHFRLPKRQRIRRLSNGQRAQVSLALAVAPDPELLIMDDPTLGLDTVVRRDFVESMIQIIQREGRTILFSSHILSDVERVADRIGIMVDGVLRVDCPLDHFRNSIRRVILAFHNRSMCVDLPELDGLPGVVARRESHNRIELVIANYTDEHRSQIEAMQPDVLEVAEMNLEDAFIDYTRGQQGTLPLFRRKNNVESISNQGAA
ncbi:ABC transporter ATP-binding protein [Planctomycetota bacterium]